MEFAELAFQVKMIDKRRDEEFKDNMTYAAFVGWQSLVADGYKKDFSRYLSELGLAGDENKTTPAERKRIIKQAYETGARVMSAFKDLKL